MCNGVLGRFYICPEEEALDSEGLSRSCAVTPGRHRRLGRREGRTWKKKIQLNSHQILRSHEDMFLSTQNEVELQLWVKVVADANPRSDSVIETTTRLRLDPSRPA